MFSFHIINALSDLLHVLILIAYVIFCLSAVRYGRKYMTGCYIEVIALYSVYLPGTAMLPSLGLSTKIKEHLTVTMKCRRLLTFKLQDFL